MKRIFPWLLCLLFLCGCGRDSAPESTDATAADAIQAVYSGYYDPDSLMEAQTGGAVRCYPLEQDNAVDFLIVDGSILLLQEQDGGTMLTALTGQELTAKASVELDFPLSTESPSLRLWEEGISFFDPAAKQIRVLNTALEEIQRISAPADLSGQPLLSYDRSTLYYCTDSALRALDLASGISRCLKEMAYPQQQVSGLAFQDSVVICSAMKAENRQTLYISTDTGRLLRQTAEDIRLLTAKDWYCASVPDGSALFHVFGSLDSSPRYLDIPENSFVSFLPESHSLLSLPLTEENSATLHCYDLDTGLRIASVSLKMEYLPRSIRSDGSRVWFLLYDENYGCDVLCRWDPAQSPVADDTFYTRNYFSPEAPDLDGLARCQAEAWEIGEKYGIEVLVYQDAAAVQPWDYHLEAEYLPGVIQRELTLLDEHLANYPDGFLSTLAGRFDGLRICIVRSLQGSAASGSLDSADGIQFMDGYTACIALAANANTEYALYHELCHLIDTVVITESGAYDRWEELNPDGFSYDYDYVANASRDSSAYLQESRRYFIDHYSMSYPKEDRARIMEYAMTEGNAHYFQSHTMQSKLLLLCQGIREAFGWEKSPETFLWEQYLHTPLAYAG